LANYKEKSAITSATPIHIASVSKVVTATAILKLVAQKKLYQKVNTILKEFPYPDVTVRTLLTHRSGMRNYAYFTEKKGSLGPTQNLNQSGHIDYYGH
jgi:CubicO group peptidase (beta-lactamase class C family)